MSSSSHGVERGRKRRAATGWRALTCFALLSIACTLTRDDFAPNEVDSLGNTAGGAGSAGAASPPGTSCTGTGCCVSDSDCGATQRCIDGNCAESCAASEDLSSCEVPLCPGPGCPDGVASCTDGVRNGREPATDCGEACPDRCEPGSACNGDADCTSGRCVEAVCSEASCSDALRNGGESAVDCGGDCPARCPVGEACDADTDCESGAFCAPATGQCTDGACQDGAQSGDELLTDCGGGNCPGCPLGSPCVEPSDCDSRVCSEGLCAVASCSDGLSSGDESGIDCGGTSSDCARCPDGDPCRDGSDCASGSCEDGSCVSCEDAAQNGSETDTDCGGANPDCARCGTGASCTLDDDCTSDNCSNGSCVAVSCTDGLRNGGESDTDCGGQNPACSRCAAGDTCNTGGDCASQVCSNGTCSACGDGIQNGGESDTDCGGPNFACARCAPGDTCQADADCASGACLDGTCCGGSLGNCTRCAQRLSQNVDCDFPAAGVDPTGVINCNAFLSCLSENRVTCPTRNSPGCSGDNQAADACPHNDYGGNAGTGITRANQVLTDAGCQL